MLGGIDRQVELRAALARWEQLEIEVVETPLERRQLEHVEEDLKERRTAQVAPRCELAHQLREGHLAVGVRLEDGAFHPLQEGVE